MRTLRDGCIFGDFIIRYRVVFRWLVFTETYEIIKAAKIPKTRKIVTSHILLFYVFVFVACRWGLFTAIPHEL